jgi:hypothetical protein
MVYLRVPTVVFYLIQATGYSISARLGVRSRRRWWKLRGLMVGTEKLRSPAASTLILGPFE